MIDQVLVDEILAYLRSECRGNANAKPRRKLMDHLIGKGLLSPEAWHDTRIFEREDRKMRRACESVAGQCGSCSRGYFAIVTAEDRRIAEVQLAAPAVAMLDRKRQIERSAPQGQLTLDI